MYSLIVLVIVLVYVCNVHASGCHVIQGVINGEILPHPTPQVKYSYNANTKRVIIDVIVPYDPYAAVIIDFVPFDTTRQSLQEYSTCENRSSEAFPDGWKMEEFFGTIADTNNFGEKVNPMYPQTGGAGMWRRRVIDCANVAYTLDAYLSDIFRACGGKIISEEGANNGLTELTVFVTYATPVDDKYVNGVSVLSLSLNDSNNNEKEIKVLEEQEEEEENEENEEEYDFNQYEDEEEDEEYEEEEEKEEEESWLFPDEPIAYEEQNSEEDGWYTDDTTKTRDNEKYGAFVTITSAFSVLIEERMGITNMSANTKLGKVKVSGPRVIPLNSKSKFKSALYLDMTTTGTTQVSLCNPKLKKSPKLPDDLDVRMIGGSCSCEKSKPSSTSTLHNLILSSNKYILPGITSGNYEIELSEITCAADGSPKILKTNGATIKFSIDSKIISGEIKHSGVSYSQQSIYASEGWGYKTFAGYDTSPLLSQGDTDLNNGNSNNNTTASQTTNSVDEIKVVPYVSLFASHPIGTPYNGTITTNPIRLLLFSTPMYDDRMGITSAYACVVGTGWNGTSEKSISNKSTTQSVNALSTQTLPRDCPLSSRKNLTLRSVVAEERSKETNSFFLSGDIFSTLDLQSARGSRVLFVVNGYGGKARLYADLGANKWDGCIINSYEGVVNFDDDDNNNNNNNNNNDDSSNNSTSDNNGNSDSNIGSGSSSDTGNNNNNNNNNNGGSNDNSNNSDNNGNNNDGRGSDNNNNNNNGNEQNNNSSSSDGFSFININSGQIIISMLMILGIIIFI